MKDARQRPEATRPPAGFLEELGALPSLTPGKVRLSSSVAAPSAGGSAPSSRALPSSHPLEQLVELERARLEAAGVELPPSTSSTSTTSTPASSPSRQVSRARARAIAKLEGQLARARARAAAPRPRGLSKRAKRKRAFLATMEAAGAAGCRPRDIPQRVWSGAASILRSLDGLQARRFLMRMPAHERRELEHLATHPGDGRELPADLSHVHSRGTIACAWALRALSRRSRRNGCSRVVDGYTQAMLCALFINATTGKAYRRGRLFATSYRRGSELCGWVTGLRRIGWFTRQPRLSEANPRFVGPPKAREGAPPRRFAFGILWQLATPPPG